MSSGPPLKRMFSFSLARSALSFVIGLPRAKLAYLAQKAKSKYQKWKKWITLHFFENQVFMLQLEHYLPQWKSFDAATNWLLDIFPISFRSNRGSLLNLLAVFIIWDFRIIEFNQRHSEGRTFHLAVVWIIFSDAEIFWVWLRRQIFSQL